MEREYFGEVRSRYARELPNWGTLIDVLGRIEKSESLSDYIKEEMERLKSEGYVDTVDEGLSRKVGPSSAINTYPGVPVGCTPIFLALIPEPKKGDLWGIVPGMEFYAKVLSEFALWVEGCDKFDLRFIFVISERESYYILRDLEFEFALWYIFQEKVLKRYRSRIGYLSHMRYFSNLIMELHNDIDIIISTVLYLFLHLHWRYPFSWYIKDKNKLVYFDGVRI